MNKRHPYHYRIIIARWALRLVTLLLVNLVIDVGSTPVQFVVKNKQQQQVVAVNDIESLYEWTMEELMNKENAVPEQDDAPDEDELIKKSEHWLLQRPECPEYFCLITPDHPLSHYIANLIVRPTDILLPPPRA